MIYYHKQNVRFQDKHPLYEKILKNIQIKYIEYK